MLRIERKGWAARTHCFPASMEDGRLRKGCLDLAMGNHWWPLRRVISFERLEGVAGWFQKE